VFVETADRVVSAALGELPMPQGPVAIAGTAALEVASRLAAREANVMLTDARYPAGQHIATAAVRRARGELRPVPAEPLYVDAPEAKVPEAKAPNANGPDAKAPDAKAPDATALADRQGPGDAPV
jgi:hypothetical protein